MTVADAQTKPVGVGLIGAGRLGTPQLLRSLTRDPGIPDPGRVPPSTIFLETLIHDFDTLRYLNRAPRRSPSTPSPTPWPTPSSGTASRYDSTRVQQP
jgi:hypothetical protein